MGRRAFLAGGAAAAGAVLLVGCGSSEDPDETGAPSGTAGTTGRDGRDEEPVPRPTLRLPGSDEGFPSPFAYRRGGGYVQMSLLYDTLMWKDSTGALIGWLAESFEQSDDATNYTFTLREGIRWHDGRPLTADDVAFTFQYFGEQTLSPQVIVQPLPTIVSVSATGERTVEFELESPTAIFLEAAANAVPIVPRHVWSTVANASEASDPAVLVGSGPYTLESYASGEGAYLYAANDDYFLGRPFVARVENRPVGDELTALLAGDLDAAGGSGLRPEALAPFEADDRFEVITAPPGSSELGLYWNLGKGGALADVAFRRACAHAIDRDDLVERLFGGNGTPGNPGWLPPGNPFHVEVEQYGFDLEEASRLLDDAGYRREGEGPRQGQDGAPLRFELLVANPVPPVVDLVVGALGALGVEITPAGLDTPSFNQRVIAGDVELSLIGAGGVNSDPDYLREVYASFTERTQHAQGYRNEELDTLAAEQLRTLDEEERMSIVARMQQIIAQDLPLLPLFYSDSVHVFDRSVFDAWYFTPGGVAVRIPTPFNRQVFVTGRDEGTSIRPTD